LYLNIVANTLHSSVTGLSGWLSGGKGW